MCFALPFPTPPNALVMQAFFLYYFPYKAWRSCSVVTVFFGFDNNTWLMVIISTIQVLLVCSVCCNFAPVKSFTK